jgi:DNA-binding NarL/FixJ family response regulator
MTTPGEPSITSAHLDRKLVTLLVAGATHEIIARRLHTSLRSTEVRIAALRTALAATTPYMLGVNAVRRGHLEAARIMAYAGRRIGDAWREPTIRQYEVLRLLASGLADGPAARIIGVSTSTLRRDLNRLATANGATSRVTAGALFEALDWN